MSGHDHAHGAAAGRAGARHARRLWWSFALVGAVFAVEAVAGVITGSLALLSDASHMLTDVVGLGMVLAAIHLANRGGTRNGRSFGLYRLEILAALLNAVLLFGVAGYVLIEAVVRLDDPPAVAPGAVLVVAAVGLAVNLVAFVLLRPGADESLNVRGAYLEVLADLVGSVAVIASAVLIGFTGWDWVDPVAGVLLGLWILPRTWRLARQALRVLVQAAPDGPRPRRARTRPGQPPRGHRRPRPARLDPHLRHGGRLRPRDGHRNRRQPRRARPGPPPARRPLRRHP